MAKFDLKEYARRGAEARVEDLKTELAAIYRAFPDLARRRSGRPAAEPREAAPARRRRKPMTAAQKKAVGARMKKYWAERRKAEAKEAK